GGEVLPAVRSDLRAQRGDLHLHAARGPRGTRPAGRTALAPAEPRGPPAARRARLLPRGAQTPPRDPRRGRERAGAGAEPGVLADAARGAEEGARGPARGASV